MASDTDRRTPGSGRSGVPLARRRPLVTTLAVTLLVAALARVLPDEYAATGIALTFLLATYRYTIQSANVETVKHYGLSLGGLLEPVALNLRRMGAETLSAIGWVGLMCLLTFAPFWLGFLWWWHPEHDFSMVSWSSVGSDALGQLLVVALPEEAFYRGYLQTSLQDKWPLRWRVFGAELGPGWLIASAVFALGHLLTDPDPSRLGVFFPALVFGWLRQRTGGIGAGVCFHAACNLFASILGRSYGLWG